MRTRLASLLNLNELEATQQNQPAASNPTPIVAPVSTSGQEVNVPLDFTNFERTIAAYTENAKNLFQTKLLNLIGNKQIFLR